MLKAVDCPYCGQPFDAVLDPSAGTQSYIEDCPVCCRPIEFHAEFSVNGHLESITTRRDDE